MRWLFLVLAGCGGVTADPGVTAKLQVEDAQFRPGAFPPDTGGPATFGLRTQHSAVIAGREDEKLNANVEPLAHTAAIGVAGFPDAWLVVAGSPDPSSPDSASVAATLGIAVDFPPGPFTLVVAAADREGHFGAPATFDVVAQAAEPPDGELVIGLIWDGPADLDIHVIDALGGEAFSDHPDTFEPTPGTTPPPDEFKNHGQLDHDANQNCKREGHPAEYVVWTVPPPVGHYIVRVDAVSMCGAPSQPWFVTAMRKQPDGSQLLVGSARGTSTPDDVALEPRGRGAGVTALQFDL
jgi:hypothetical protein